MSKLKSLFSSIWPALVIFIFCLLAIKPLFIFGFFPIHDDEQVARIFEMNTVVFQGQFPPRWVPDLGFGYGYPLFNFYPPFVYYLGVAVHLLGFSYINTTKVIIGIGFFLSGFFMYLWTKNRFGILAGLFSALLYIYVPYHSVDIYVRGALSEFFSFVWIPAVFWSLDRLAKEQSKKNIFVTSVLLCLVVLTHSLVMLQFSIFLLLYMLYLLYEHRNNFKRLSISFLIVGIVGFGLTSYFAIPSVLEKQYTLVDTILTKQLANYAIHFVCPNQFWNSPWGYGGSIAGCVDGLSFQVGKLHLILAGVAVCSVLAGWFFKKRQSGVIVLIIGMFCFSLVIQTEYSKFIWDKISPLWYIQFPWRFLLFSAVFSSFLGGYLLSIVEKFYAKSAIICFILLSLGTVYFIRNDFRPQTYLALTDDHYLKGNDITWRVSGLSYEYVPKEVATKISNMGTTVLAISKKDIPRNPFTVVSGHMELSLLGNTAIEKNLTTRVTMPGVLQVNSYAFPGWKVLVDGKEQTYNDANSLHLIQIPLSTGQHRIRVIFTNTPIRTKSNLLSLFFLTILVGILFLPKRVFLNKA